MKLLALDKFKLVFLILYTIAVGVLVLAGVEVPKEIQHVLIVLTHLPAVALVIVLWETMWVAITVAIGVFVSVVFHIAVIYDWNVDSMEPLDIGFANLTLFLIGIMVVYKKIPEWTLPLLFTMTIIYTNFWQSQMVYLGISSLFNAGVTLYVLYRVCNPTPNRDTGFMVLALVVGIVGTGYFLLDGNHHSPNYSIMHSVWHVCSYSALYFLLRSTNINSIRVPRTDFTPEYTNILAYSDFKH